MNLRKPLIGLALAGILGAAVLFARAQLLPGARAAQAAQNAQAVRATVGPLRDVIVAKGTLTYAHQVVLRAPIAGRLGPFTLSEGAPVRRAQQLLRIDDVLDPSDLALRQLELQRTQARIDSLAREVATLRRLVEIGSSARFELEQKELEHKLSLQDLERATIDARRVRDKQRLSQLTSPLEGIVMALPVVPGQSVNAGEELLTVAGGEQRLVVAYVDAMDVTRIRPGQAVLFTDQEDGGTRRHGRVREIGAAIAPGQRQNSVKVTVDPLEAPGNLRIAQQLYVEFVIQDEQAVLRVPRELLYTVGDQQFVNVLGADGVRPRQVRTAPGDSSFERVLGGITASDRLVRRTAKGSALQ